MAWADKVDEWKELSGEEVLENNVKELEAQLEHAYQRMHSLHDIIEEMKLLSQCSLENLKEAINIGNNKWEKDYDKSIF
tara:strand:- start:155 stop:391 length:237 start_codon:yes stop_codon:yes gene_type:complete